MSVSADQRDETERENPSFRQVLKNRNFLLLWLAQVISQIVFNGANFGLIVIVNDVTHSVLMAGFAILIFTVPAVPFSVIAGAIVDHFPKRTVLWVSNILRAVAMLLIVVSLLFSYSNLWPIYVLMFFAVIIGQFFTPAESASIPLLVGEYELVPALSLFNVTITLAQAVGYLVLGTAIPLLFPSFVFHLGSTAFTFHSTDALFAIAAVFYIICAGLIFLIPARAIIEEHLKQQKAVDQARMKLRQAWGTLRVDVAEGWRFVRSDHVLYFSVIQLSVAGNIMILIAELAGPFVQQVLHLPAAAMAIVMAPAAIGLVGASLVMPRVATRLDKVRLSIVALVVMAGGFAVLPLAQGLAWLLYRQNGASSPFLLGITITLVFVLGVAMACVNIPAQTLMQEHSPEEVRGRVFSLQLMLYNVGSIPALIIAGLFAQYIDFDVLLFVLAGSLLLFGWWGRSFVRSKSKVAAQGSINRAPD
ncbi:MAG: MFS transporter [Ktedonobacteraceae bacterium]